jgi:hypothetical protein
MVTIFLISTCGWTRFTHWDQRNGVNSWTKLLKTSNPFYDNHKLPLPHFKSCMSYNTLHKIPLNMLLGLFPPQTRDRYVFVLKIAHRNGRKCDPIREDHCSKENYAPMIWGMHNCPMSHRGASKLVEPFRV